MLAVVAAFPTVGWPQASRPNLSAPPLSAVPIPKVAGWVVSTSGGPLTPFPTNSRNAAGGVNQVINQASQSAVYNWQSFDIGSSSSVTFNLPNSASSALNRITGGTPTQIFGRLISQFTNPAAGGAPLLGGSIYLINANGILFGRGAQVNTGALIASTLDLTLGDADFYAGLTQSIKDAYSPSFGVSGTPAWVPNNFVWVDPGVNITTSSGGRVFLFANNLVQNQGTIATPNGQTVLAAGDQIFLSSPTTEPLYLSEANPAIPAVNGLLVEVGTGRGTVVNGAPVAGSSVNLSGGVINTPTGNTTLVAMAVNQLGRINATTSVSQDGSVFLLARSGAPGTTNEANQFTGTAKEAQTGGVLTLGPGSHVEIDPDTTMGSNGQQATSNAYSTFTPSLVELSGAAIDLQQGATIVAHGGLVVARAETSPYYQASAGGKPSVFATYGTDSARIVVEDGAAIDVFGYDLDGGFGRPQLRHHRPSGGERPSRCSAAARRAGLSQQAHLRHP